MSFLVPKMRKPRGFNYQPIYWDPEKERREEQIKKAKADLGLISKEEAYSPGNLEGAFSIKGKKSDAEYGRKQRGSNLSLVVILVLLLLLVYVLYFA